MPLQIRGHLGLFGNGAGTGLSAFPGLFTLEQAVRLFVSAIRHKVLAAAAFVLTPLPLLGHPLHLQCPHPLPSEI